MEDENDSPDIEVSVRPQGISVGLLVFLLILVGLLAGSSGYFLSRTAVPDYTAQMHKAEMDEEKARWEFDNNTEKRTQEIRMRVIDECVKRGGQPLFLGVNIECRGGAQAR